MVCDLGCGSGFLALCCALLYPGATVTGLEISPRRAEAARGNAEANGLRERFRVLEADVRETSTLPGEPFELVLSNPPFSKLGRGPVPKDPDKAVARFETLLDMEAVIAAVARFLAPEGTATLVYPFDRARELEERLEAHGFVATRMRPVRPRAELPDSHVLCACQRRAAVAGPAPRRLEEPPLLLEGPERTLGPELSELASRFDLTSEAQ